MSNENERRLILEMIDRGKISAEDGLHLLQSLPEEEIEEGEDFYPESFEQQTYADASPEEHIAAPLPLGEQTGTEGGYRSSEENSGYRANTAKPDFNRWRGYWIIPLWIGVGITIGGSLLMLWAAQTAGLGFWFLCASVPFAIGVLTLALAWQSRSARWLHLRVQQRPGEWPRTIAFSFPLPLRISSWFMRIFKPYIPGMQDVSIDEMLSALETSTSSEEPLTIEVEEDDGERVQIYIG